MNLLNELSELLKRKKSKLYYATKLGVSLEEVEKLLEELKRSTNYLHVVSTHPTQDYIVTTTSDVRLTSEKVAEDGSKELQFTSDRPLTKKEIEEKYGIDGISTKLSNYWNKELPSGKYIVSAFVKCLVENFYSEDELKDKLKNIFPDIKPTPLPEVIASEKLLTILIADDHAGMLNETNLYNKEEYTFQTYKNRLLKIVAQVNNLNTVFEEIHIISLGDQLNGWNSQTTRGGHPVKSMSNKDQFDFYTEARKTFYDALFTSGAGKSYVIHEVDNSNHSGLGFSYAANKCLSLYLGARFPEVNIHSAQEAITGFVYGDHAIVYGHGKDEKFQKKPFPYNLDARTDLFIYDWLLANGINAKEKIVTYYKGDLHCFGINKGKFGRYINVPSIAGNSDYGDINFGDSQAGAILEVYEKHTNTITTQPIWF